MFVAAMIGAVETDTVAYPPFLFKAKKFGATDCTFCHVNPEGGPPWNERGKWLIQEKERRKADQVDVEWLAEYKAQDNKLASVPLTPQAPLVVRGTIEGGRQASASIDLGGHETDTFVYPESTFVTLEQAWMKAVADRDEEALKRLMSPDFTLTSAYSAGDLISRDQFLKTIQSVKQNEFSFYNVTVRVNIYGDVAILKAKVKDNYTMNGEDRSGDYLITDVWVKHDGQWQVVTRHSSLPMKPQPKG
jgi:uncharacterized protein (TIGR02246 family)